MLTIKDSISSLILFTSPTVARLMFYKYTGEEGKKGQEMQMQTYICWSTESQISAKSKISCLNMHLSFEFGDKGAILKPSIQRDKWT